jgi:NAD(P)-dependent dehydrogenase (short-subunit alcohol dehydrogenase family)
MRFKNKTVLIIGGSSGIGLATAKKYAAENANALIVGKTEDTLKKAAIEIGNKTSFFIADISKVSSIESIYKQLNEKAIRIDVLIVCVGLGKFGGIDEVNEEDYDLVMNTNTKGTFFAVKIFKNLINEGGNIILLSSFIANKFIPLTAVLSASKVAVETFTKIVTRELIEKRIRVNAVCPESIKTNFMNVASPTIEQQQKLSDYMPQIPLGKRGEVDQIANAILFLSSEEANYINGAILSVDGCLSIT